MIDLSMCTPDTFSELLNDSFVLHVDAPTDAALKLIDVTSHTAAGKADSSSEQRPSPDRPFSLVFQPAGDFELGQGTYRIEHQRLGSLDVFLVPIGRDREGNRMQYEAVFN